LHFGLLPDRVVLRIMAACDVRSVGTMARVCRRTATLAADRDLWRRLYVRDFPLCDARSGCLLRVHDGWFFGAGDDGSADDLDNGPSAGHAAECPSGPRHDDGEADDRATRWAARCRAVTRPSAERLVPLCTPTAGCPHHPPSLVRARGYRWAYASNARPLVFRVRSEHDGARGGACGGHLHRIVHRGPSTGLALQTEICLARSRAAPPCDAVVWRWGRFADGLLSGLGTQAATPCASVGGSNAADVVSGLWHRGTVRGPRVHRDARGRIVIVGAGHRSAGPSP
jgi:hypothetical protein